MKEEDIHQFADELEEHLKKELFYKKLELARNFTLTLSVFRKRFELHLRWKDHNCNRNSDTFTFARIGFKSKFKGHGTSLLKFVSDRTDKYDIKYISIECCNNNSRAFGTVFGFKDCIKHKDCICISASDLKINISEYLKRKSLKNNKLKV